MMTLFCVACGGGGGDSSNSTGNNNGNTGGTTNSAPVLSVSPNTYSMEENTTGSVTVSATDANSDTLIFSFTTDSVVSTAYDASTKTLSLSAGEVSSDYTGTITISVSDGQGGTDSETLTVNVTNKVEVVVNEAPTFVFVDGDLPSYSVVETGRLVVPFEVSDPDTNLADLSVTFEMDSYDVSLFSNHTYSVDISNGNLVIDFGELTNYGDAIVTGNVVVSDGDNTLTNSFEVYVDSIRVAADVAFDLSTIETEVDYQINYVVRAVSTSQFFIEGIDYADSNNVNSELLTFSLDQDAKILNLRASSAAAGQTIDLMVTYGESQDLKFSKIISVNIADAMSTDASNVYDAVVIAREKVSMSREYEYVAQYLVDYLFATGSIDSAVRDKYMDDIDTLYGDVYDSAINVLDSYEHLAKFESYYWDYEDAYSSAIYDIDYQVTLADTSVSAIRDYVNALLSESALSYSEVGLEAMDFTPSVYSRFIGNTTYGSYVNGGWFFSDEYRYLEAPIKKMKHSNSL